MITGGSLHGTIIFSSYASPARHPCDFWYLPDLLLPRFVLGGDGRRVGEVGWERWTGVAGPGLGGTMNLANILGE